MSATRRWVRPRARRVSGGKVANRTWRDLLSGGLALVADPAAGVAGAADPTCDPAAPNCDPTAPAISALKHLLAAASGMSPTELALNWDETAHPKDIAAFERMLHSWLAGKPLQYVLGSWGFRSLDLYLDERVLIPRPETETLVEIANQELARQRLGLARQRESVVSNQNLPADQRAPKSSNQNLPAPRRLRVADLGCGSGAIGLSLAAENTDTEIFCCDISHDALAVARANLAGLGMAASPVYIAQGSWYQGLAQAVHLAGESSGEGSFAVICSNPPYVANCEELPRNVAEHEPPEALFAGETGTEAIAELLAGAAGWLADGGAFVCEIAPRQADFVGQLAQDCGLVDVELSQDLAGRTRILRARKPAPAP